jgi:ribosomal protein S18 acetylase RimI-like enzyme
MIMADYPAVYALWKTLPGIGLRTLDDSEEGIRAFLKRNPRTCFVAEADTSGEGRAMAGVILSGHDGRRGFIYHAAVREQNRGKGLGKALVQAVEDAMGREGIHKIALVAFKDNEAGNRFWEARGFSPRDDLVYRDKGLNPENR